MKLKNNLLFISAAFLGFFFLSSETPVTTKAKPCEVTGQFSPTSGSFAYCAFTNCNGGYNTPSVAVNTNWIPILQGAGCNYVTITTSLPDNHPSGTITIVRGITTVVTHTVSAGQDAYFVDNVKAGCDDYFHINW